MLSNFEKKFSKKKITCCQLLKLNLKGDSKDSRWRKLSLKRRKPCQVGEIMMIKDSANVMKIKLKLKSFFLEWKLWEFLHANFCFISTMSKKWENFDFEAIRNFLESEFNCWKHFLGAHSKSRRHWNNKFKRLKLFFWQIIIKFTKILSALIKIPTVEKHGSFFHFFFFPFQKYYKLFKRKIRLFKGNSKNKEKILRKIKFWEKK